MSQSGQKVISQGTNENSKSKRANCLKRGKTRVTKPRLVLALNLIGRERGAGLLDQSQSEGKQNQSKTTLILILLGVYFAHLFELFI